MSGEVLGSIFNQNGYSTARMRAVWTDENRLKVVCQVETALAYAMAKAGNIPESAYQQIQARLVPENFDLTQLRLAAARSGHFLAGFVSAMHSNCLTVIAANMCTMGRRVKILRIPAM